MSKHDDHDYTKVTKADIAFILLVMFVCSVFVNHFILKDKPEPAAKPMPLEYNLLCKKNFDMPSRANVVLECMNVRKEGN